MTRSQRRPTSVDVYIQPLIQEKGESPGKIRSARRSIGIVSDSEDYIDPPQKKLKGTVKAGSYVDPASLKRINARVAHKMQGK